MARARLPQWVASPWTWIRKYQLPAAIGETVNGYGIEDGSVTMAASAVNPASSTAEVPSVVLHRLLPDHGVQEEVAVERRSPASASAWATSHIVASDPFMSVEPIP